MWAGCERRLELATVWLAAGCEGRPGTAITGAQNTGEVGLAGCGWSPQCLNVVVCGNHAALVESLRVLQCLSSVVAVSCGVWLSFDSNHDGDCEPNMRGKEEAGVGRGWGGGGKQKRAAVATGGQDALLCGFNR